MLSRSGSSTNSSLQRTKSTTSVKERRKHPIQAESVNPQTARTHALIAAHRAVDRSQAGISGGTRQSGHDLSRRSTITSHRDQTVSFSPASHLQRQRSTLQNRVPRLADALQIPSTNNRRGRKCVNIDFESEFGSQGENYGAEPSSFRRLKRARSLLTPVRHGPHSSSEHSESAFSQAPTLRTAASSVALRSPGLKLRLKRSLNFLRGSPLSPERVVTAPAQLQSKLNYRPESIALARNQFLQSLEEHQVSKKPSISFSSRAKRAIKPFRSTVRDECRQLDGTAREQSLTKTQNYSKGDWVSSESFSGRIKKIFGKGKQDRDFPPQHLEASRAHFGDNSTTIGRESGFDTYLDAETSSSRRSSLYILSDSQPDDPNKIVYLPQKLSQSSSSESLISNSKSRVTSWTNSTATGSIAARPPSEEPKRLSIIKEDGGPHQPSSSVGRHIRGISVFQQPLNIPAGQTVNSQRVYSALLKRIDEEQKEIEQTQAALKEIHDAQEQDDIIGHYLFSAPTIRRVDSEGIQPLKDFRENKPRADGHSDSTAGTLLGAVNPPMEEQKQLDGTEGHQLSRSQNTTIYSSSQLCDTQKSYQPIRQFLGSQGVCKSGHGFYELDSETGSVINRTQSHTQRLDHSRFGYSTESVYSRTTNGGTNLDYMSPVVSMEDVRCQSSMPNNIAAILHPQPSRVSIDERSQTCGEPNLSRSATERSSWRGWMERQMEDLPQKKSRFEPVSHVREHAQIDPEDTQVGQSPQLQQKYESELQIKKIRGSNALVSLKPSPIEMRRTKDTLGSQKSTTPDVKLKEVSRNLTPTPEKNVVARRSQYVLSNQTSNATKEASSENKRKVGLRDISTGNGKKLIKARKSQPTFFQQSMVDKENSPLRTSESPPASTPGRCSVRLRNDYNAGRLRKGASAFSLRERYENAKSMLHREILDNSPSGGNKGTLTARLSRPFDMDTPNQNRPFDSTYLGRRQPEDDSRLSVAPSSNIKQRPKTYGDLGPPPFTHTEQIAGDRSNLSGPTALPLVSDPDTSQRTASGFSIGQASKRLVSSFLKNKRKQEASEIELLTEDGPAFV